MNRNRREWLIIAVLTLAIIILFVFVIEARGQGFVKECWAFCKPKDRVNLRISPSKSSKSVGWLECGDSFQTDGTERKGWIRVLDRGECECWIYGGYVVNEQPVKIDESYVCVAKKWVACRRWVDGPQIKGKLGWLRNGNSVNVFYIGGGWAITSRGYIRSEWLEVDPQ